MKIESYKQGTPCWICLGTSDVEGGKRFYTALFGWHYEQTEMFPGMPNSPIAFNAKKGDELVGVIAPQMEGDPVGASWGFNWAVDDVSVTVTRAAELGGTVSTEPMEMQGQGKVAVVTDINDVETILWEGKEHLGAGLMFEHGTFTWAQLITRNRNASSSFLMRLLGLGLDSGPAPGGGMNDVLMLGDEPMVGIMDMPDEVANAGTPNHWIVYFHVDDVDATLGMVAEHDGRVIMQPNQLAHIGRIAVASDPQGAMFGLVSPAD